MAQSASDLGPRREVVHEPEGNVRRSLGEAPRVAGNLEGAGGLARKRDPGSVARADRDQESQLGGECLGASRKIANPVSIGSRRGAVALTTTGERKDSPKSVADGAPR